MIMSSKEPEQFFRWQYCAYSDTNAARKYLNAKKLRNSYDKWAIALRQELGEGTCHVTALASG
jgi:hypothetical protein